MKHVHPVRLPRAIVVTVLCFASVSGQDAWTWPEKLKNLQVLPKEWAGSRL